MTDAMRRDLILGDLLQAVQDGQLSRKEMEQALWLLNTTTDWKIQNLVGVPTSLLAKLIQACPLLNDEHAVPPVPTEEPKSVARSRVVPPAAVFGFTPSTE